ncbi:MAG: RlmE family RNA methyltransferase [Pseudomonadota bacterium]
MTKKKSSRPPDYWARRAKEEGLLARSAYKLEEMDEKYGLVRPHDAILDLGAAPGSWLQHILKRASQGVVVGVDLQRAAPKVRGRMHFIQADVFALDPARLRQFAETYDVVLSDLAPATSGSAFVDSQRSLRLAERALELSLEVLGVGGRFVVKVFQGEDFEAYRRAVEQDFEDVEVFKPKSSRKESNEIYLIALGRKSPPWGGTKKTPERGKIS